MMKTPPLVSSFLGSASIVAGLNQTNSRNDLNEIEKAATEFVQTDAVKWHDLNTKAGYAYWNLLTLGGVELKTDSKDFEERLKELQQKHGEEANNTQKAVIDFTTNPEVAKRLISIYQNRSAIENPFLGRQISLAYPIFSEYNIDPDLQKRIVDIGNNLSLMYGDFKPVVKGNKVEDSELEDLLSKTKGHDGIQDAIELTSAKLAVGNHKIPGGEKTIAETILEAIKLRNLFAKKAGADNYYSYNLQKQEIDENELINLMAAVKLMIKPTYDKLREKMDHAAQERYGISKNDARLIWFQGGVKEYNILNDVMKFNSDDYFKGMDPRPLLKETGRLMGIDVDSIVDKSDLFPRPGKNPHWYLFNLRVPDDIRSFGNINPKFEREMGYVFSTEFHEVIGHGGGYSFVDSALAHLLKDLHTIVTESDAMMMEDLMFNEHWLREVAKFDTSTIETFINQGVQHRLAHELLTFFKNFLLIPDFERTLYHLPDSELTLEKVNKLWAEKQYEYLGVKVPEGRNEPDWAYKIHLATAPVYYQCYFLGQLLRAQVRATIENIAKERGLFSKETGDFLRIYRGVGQSYPWSELTKHMTGKSLGVDALKAEFEKLKLN